MLGGGLVDEGRGLLERPWGKEGRRAVGYREVIGYLEGRYDLVETERLISRNTHNLARHQLMWFKRMSEVRWVESGDEITSFLS